MKSLEEEARFRYGNLEKGRGAENRAIFIAGANSKWVQAEIIKEKMSLISNLRCSYDDSYYMDLEYDRLEKQLKELDDSEINSNQLEGSKKQFIFTHEEWIKQFHCDTCGSDSQHDFVYQYRYANGEEWMCLNCRNNIMVDFEPEEI